MGSNCAKLKSKSKEIKRKQQKTQDKLKFELPHERTLKYKKINNLYARPALLTLRTELFWKIPRDSENSTPKWNANCS